MVLDLIGTGAGSHQLQDAADTANRQPPQLRTYTRTGERIDDVEFDPSWHRLLDEVLASGVTGMPWDGIHGYAGHAAGFEMWARLDMGVMCPVSMTSAAIPVLAAEEQWNDLIGRLASRRAPQATAGMAMTEPQGGSDLSMSTTTASDRGDGSFAIDGHKWFLSHPVADILLVLAREPGLPEGSRGLSCFLVPAAREDGSRNGIELQRLKNKLGTHSLASSEAMFHNADGYRIGEPGAGVRTIIQMVIHTRMHCAVGSSGTMMRCVQEAAHHCMHRNAFGAPLIEQPLMRAVLADLALEREASLALGFELARTFDADDSLLRLLPAVAKYWITRRAVSVAIEAVECLGGNGYTEDWVLARLYRDAQVNSTWEGSGNVIVLDTFRALTSAPELLEQWRDRLTQLMDGCDTATLERVLTACPTHLPDVARGRTMVARLATTMQAALLHHRAVKTGDPGDQVVADTFVATRLDAQGDRVFGDGDLLAAADALLPRIARSFGTN
jgi:putative acyl-CoA dehydrogenase